MNHGYTKHWTEADLESMGYHKVVIGIPGRPLPIMVPNPDASSSEDAYRLEAIEDAENPIIIWSMRRYDEVVGLLYRLLPTPSMLPLFYETLQLLQVENERRIQFYIGKHGSGKSFLGKLVGDILHPEGSITVNCADRDLNELLFETVLDVQANPDLYTKINERLRSGTMNSTSAAALRAVAGDAFSTKDGAPWIDFERIGGSRVETVVSEEGIHETQVMFSDANTKDVVETLLKIAQVEGLSKEASFMPIRSQLGLLPRVWLDGRVIHLEEYNKCKEGSDTCLHPVLQVFNGENLKCRVYGSGGLSFAFDNNDRLPGFFCYLDGNMQADGVATHTLSASANDRILPNIIQDMIREDWQHRWSQLLTGLPIRILYDSKRDQWEADPESFTRFLHMIRGLGGVTVPPSHRHYIDRWEDVLDATEIISRYNQLYDEMTNPDSAANRAGKYPELFSEVDEEFYNMAGGSMRRNIYYFKMALLGRPGTKPPHLSQGYDMSIDWSTPPAINVSKQDYNPSEKLGSNIASIFYRDMVRLTLGLGKVQLYARLKAACESLRIIKPELSEGANVDGVYLEDLLNSAGGVLNKNREVQELLCAHMREALAGTPLSRENDHLMTVDQVGTALQKAADRLTPTHADARVAYLVAQHYAPLVTVDNLLGPCAMLDAIGRAGILAAPAPDKLMAHDELLLALALPKTGKKSMQALFPLGLYDRVDSVLRDFDDALLIASNRSGLGIAMSTVVVRSFGQATTCIHILRDTRKDLTLLIGDAISEQLANFLKSANIEFIVRGPASARTKIQTFLNRLLIQAPPETESLMATAFFLRNAQLGFDLLRNIDRLDGMKVADLLSAGDTTPVRPVYATRVADSKAVDALLQSTAQELSPQHRN